MLTIVKNSKYVSGATLRRISKEVFSFVGEEYDVGVKFACENCIRGLNKEYRGKDEPTNVLTFNVDDSSKDGDIVICEAVVLKESELLRYKTSDLIALYFVHGMLHLAGFDHQKVLERAKMEKIEEEILNKVGVKIERK